MGFTTPSYDLKDLLHELIAGISSYLTSSAAMPGMKIVFDLLLFPCCAVIPSARSWLLTPETKRCAFVPVPLRAHLTLASTPACSF